MQTTRRTFLKSLVATAVIGFDPISRSWITSAEAASTFDALPRFDGEIVTDSAAIESAADDFGHIIHRRPHAVLRPGSVNDIVRVVRYARQQNLEVSAQGQRHSTYGQGQVEAGIAIDMSPLSAIRTIRRQSVDVEAGALWSSVLRATLEQGLTPPVLTDYLELSIGGTLSVGGIGGASHRYGAQVDNVLELQVVTGEGKLEVCSMDQNRRLFEAVLGGLGQYAIIVRARLRLIAAETHARVFMLYYDDLATFTADQRTVINDERFNYVEGQVIAKDGGGWRYMLEAASFYSPPAQPNNARLLGDLRYTRGSEQIDDRTYFDFANRLEATVAFLKSIGVWAFPHPWFDVWVPGSVVNQYVGDIVSTLTLADTGQGPILLYPIKNSRFKMPFLRLPDEQTVFLFDILRTAPPDQAVVNAMVADNRALHDQLREQGGLRYPIGAIPFTRQDWRVHYQGVWEEVQRAKRRYDPDVVLTPGQGIFPRNR